MTGPGGAPSPTLVLYGRPGCHLCEEAEATVRSLLLRRGVDPGRLEVRDIGMDPGWERAFLATIPVLEAGDRRYELATSPARITAFVDEAFA